MSISEHVEEFGGLPVRQYDPEEGVTDPAGAAQRLSVEYDDGRTIIELLTRFLADPATPQVTALVVGSWSADDHTVGSEGIVATLAAARDRLPALNALFLGDIISEENEISWIQQCDVTPVLTAYPALEEFRVRGSEGLALGNIRHEGLRKFVVEDGGLPGKFVRSVCAADLPNLEHLELWLGSKSYSGDSTPADLAPVHSGGKFPRLKFLGLRDCEYADALAAALAEAPVLRRIEVLDLSLGNLGDEGALALLAGGNLGGLRKLDIHHHFVSDEVLDGLKALGFELDDHDRQKPYRHRDGSEDRFIAVTE